MTALPAGLAGYRAPARPVAHPATLPDVAERLFAGAVLLFLSEALLGPLLNPAQSNDAAPVLRTMWVPIYGLIALACTARIAVLPRVFWGAVALLPLLLLAGISTQWSILPDFTLRRTVALGFTSLFGLYLAARFDWRELIGLLAGVFLILALGSYASVLVAPNWAITQDIHQGAWKALWFQKNALGQMMAWGTLTCGCAALFDPARRRLWCAGAVLCALLVICSTSKTGLLALLLVGAGLASVAGFRRGGVWRVATAWLVVVGGAVTLSAVVFAPGLVLEALGKDPTLTGRTDIWDAVLRRVNERPWQGYGYGAFWENKQGPLQYVRREVDWNVPTAHNGWLELLLSFGWTGVIVFAAHLALTTVAALASLGRGPQAYWAPAAVGLFVLYSLSESSIMQHNNLVWALYVMTSAKLLQVREPAPPR